MLQTICNRHEIPTSQGREKGLGIVRRHCRNGNVPSLIFDSLDGITINWADGTYCVLPETLDQIVGTLQTIQAFHGCPIACGSDLVGFLP